MCGGGCGVDSTEKERREAEPTCILDLNPDAGVRLVEVKGRQMAKRKKIGKVGRTCPARKDA